MNLTHPAKIAIICGVFLLTLLISSSFDIALSLSLALFFFFFQKNAIPIFIISILLFLADIFYRSSEVHFRFITDLTVDAYILFLTAVVVYLRSRSGFTQMLSKLGKSDRNLFSKNQLLQLGISLIFTMLVFPVLGGYLAALSGYIFYSYLTRQFNGRIAIVVSLGFLVGAAVFLVIKRNVIAEVLANYIYLFIVVGTVQEVINLVRYKESGTRKMPEGAKYEEVRKSSFTFPGIGFPRINIRLVLAAVFLLIVSLILYFLFPVLSKSYKSLKIPVINFKIPSVNLFLKPTPTIVLSPTFTPSPAPSITPTPILKASSSSAKLKILVLNGTEIAGLAATTSAKLKKVGFQNVEIGNAQRSDYKTWEILFKKHDEDIVGIIKNILELDTLTAKQASQGAKFDIEIIAGEGK